jgi:Protein of unknown function (DUF2889)
MTATLPDLDLELLHDRQYSVQVYRKNDHELLARGHVRDVKPPGLYVEGDPDPLVLHDMVVDLTVAYPSYEIAGVEVVFDTHPQPTCPAISGGYQQLVGLSVTRGYTHRLRELFGGPRGCAHVTALLQAMGPALIQSGWSMRISESRRAHREALPGEDANPDGGDDERVRIDRVGRNVNTCHVWAEDGDLLRRVAAGERVGPGLPIQQRLRERGEDPDTWWDRQD